MLLTSTYSNYIQLTKLTAPCWLFLPIELTWHVVAFIYLSDFKGNHGGQTSRKKSGLAACSLVCRYWAQCARPLLFGTLALRSPEDVSFLLLFLKARPVHGIPHPSQTLQHITYQKLDNRIVPWLRLGTILKLASTAEFKFVVTHDGMIKPSEAIDGYSILRCFPRTLPISVFPPCTGLDIAHTKFDSRIEPVHLMHRLPPASSCEISFGDLTYTQPAMTIPQDIILRKKWLARASSVSLTIGSDASAPSLSTSPPDSPNFETHLGFAWAAVGAREGLRVSDLDWSLLGAAIVALVPPTYQIASIGLTNINSALPNIPKN